MADRKQLARKELARRELSRRKSIQQEPSLGQRSLGLGKGLVEQLPFQFNPFAQFRSAKRIASSATGQSGEKTSQVLREELLRPKSEAESLGRSFLSEAAFGAPRALLPENLEQEIIPDPTSDFGKFIKPAVDVGGFIFGPGNSLQDWEVKFYQK